MALSEMIGNRELLHSINAHEYVNEHYGLPTIRDVLSELEKPGRDPRPEFKTAQFKEGVEKISDLQEGMILEGVVSNVTNFGAFVDIGVHQDGLVHISAMTHKFISDPRTVVKAGEIVKVKVVEVDVERKRIGLSMKLDEKTSSSAAPPKTNKPVLTQKQIEVQQTQTKKKTEPPIKKEPVKKTLFNTAMADALSKLKQGGK